MITGKLLVHGLALLLNTSPYTHHCYCVNNQQNCDVEIIYYQGAYRNMVTLNDWSHVPISGIVDYQCAPKKKAGLYD